MRTNSFDVIVIGAGVAGSSAAYELATAGLKVLVLEKEKLPRYKTCGGGVVLRATKLLPFSFNSIDQKQFLIANVIDQENKITFRIERKQPIIFMMMRAEFDYFLLSKAIEKGAKVYDALEIMNLTDVGDGVEVKSNGQTYLAKYVIGCDGATGFTMTRFKLSQNILRVPAVESELFVDNEMLERFSNVVRFDYGFVPHGYGWVFPKKDHLSVGVAFMRKVDQSIQAWFQKYLKLLDIRPENILKNEQRSYVIPLIHGKVNCCNGRVLFAGDNLGFVDPLTAEGISYAIETGQLATKAIIKHFPESSKVAQRYKTDVESIYREIKSARFLSRVVYGPPRLRKFIFKHWGKKLSELLTDAITNEKKYSGIVRNPMNYIKLFKPKYLTGEK